jgi:hypothetical protein
MGAPDGPLIVRDVEMLTIAGVADLATPTKPWSIGGAAATLLVAPPSFVARINPIMIPKDKKLPAISPMTKFFCLNPAMVSFSSANRVKNPDG